MTRHNRNLPLLGLIVIAMAGAAAADFMVPSLARLPSGRFHTAAAWSGDAAFVFGGYPPTDDILHYDPDLQSITAWTTTLPGPRWAMTAVWADGAAYLFGGLASVAPVRRSDILRFDPAGGISTLETQLPSARYAASAVWTGREVFLFGGIPATDEIVRFDPATSEVQVMDARLPVEMGFTSAVWDGRYAYVFGGSGPSGISDAIVRFDPARDEATVLGAALPEPLFWTSAVWTGSHAQLFGGIGGGNDLAHRWVNGYRSHILAFDPVPSVVATMAMPLPTPRAGTSAVWTGATALVFGGACDCGASPVSLRDDIVHYAPAAGPPILVGAAPAGDGHIRLEWWAPPEATYGALTGYRIHRSGPDLRWSPVGTVGPHSTTFLDAPPGSGPFLYRVAAFNGAGEGAESNPLPVLVPEI